MSSVTLKVKVGRAEAQPLHTAEGSDVSALNRECDAIELNKRAELLRSGVAPDRIVFERDTKKGK